MISVNDNDKNLNKLVNNTKKKEEKGKTSSPDTSEKDKKQGQMPIRRGRNEDEAALKVSNITRGPSTTPFP